MFFFQMVNTFSHEVATSVQPGAASAIYWSIVIAATSLAILVLCESVLGHGEGRHETNENEATEDQPLEQAA